MTPLTVTGKTTLFSQVECNPGPSAGGRIVGGVWDEPPPEPEPGPGREPGPQTSRAKAIVVLVVTVVMLVTLVLCCVAIGAAAKLIELNSPSLW